MIDFAFLFERSPNPYMLVDRELRFVAMNEAYLRATGRQRDELLGVGLFEAFPGDPADPDATHVRTLRDSLERVFATGQADTLGLIRYSIPRQTPTGIVFDDRYWSATHTPMTDESGRVVQVLQHTVDVTELQRLKAELHEARQHQPREQLEHSVFERARVVQETNQLLDTERQHLLRLFDKAPGFMAFLRGPQHVFELANPSYLRLVRRRDIIGLPLREVLPEIEGQGYFELLDQVYRTGKPFVGRAMRVEIEGDGDAKRETAYVDLVYQPVQDADGQVVGILAQGHDITPQMQAQEELQRYRDHLEELVQERTHALEVSEAALRQAQKMEAVGRLTGGVAHDFNNVLQVIGANLQLLALSGPVPPSGYVRAALDGVLRGSKLAAQLLAFARRQPLQPVVLDTSAHLRQLDELLRRTLGESVQLQIDLADTLSHIEVDAHQLDNALLNLAINARDAMQGHGHLKISARNVSSEDIRGAIDDGVPPGEYVEISVADSGEGMSDEVLRQAFDPFFTTKPEGLGTGLGLSMVYGFVKQTGGHVAISSVLGAGTTVMLYLPRSASQLSLAPELSAAVAPCGSETVLVVEDDPAVRATAAALLGTLGYQVLMAADGAQAWAMIESGAKPHVLFTDVVMPGPLHTMELVRLARERVPGLAVLYTSGYPQQSFDDGRLDPDIQLLGKPYRREELAARMREVIGRIRARESKPVTTSQATSAKNDAGRRVLLVEDDEDTRLTTTELLRLLGYESAGVASATQALDALAAQPWDVLMSDVKLPDISGVELAARARALYPELRVVLATGFAAADFEQAAGVDEVLTKPYSPDQLQRALDRAAKPMTRAMGF